MIKLEKYEDKDVKGFNIVLGKDKLDGGTFEVSNDDGTYTITYFPPEIDQKENNCKPIYLLQITE